MNIENFQKLRDAIAAAPEEQFDMRYVFDGEGSRPLFGDDPVEGIPHNLCGSTACMMGFAAHLATNGGRLQHRRWIWDVASEYLGLDDPDDEYFAAGDWSPNGLRATRAEALAYLRACIEQRTVRPVMP